MGQNNKHFRQNFNRNETIEAAALAVRKALRSFDLSSAEQYLDGYYGSILAPVLARSFKLPEPQVSVGYGAEFFLRSFFDACDPRSDIILTNAPHYGFYDIYAKARKVKIKTFDIIDREDHFEFDIEGCIEQIKKLRPKIVLITSPNNPTGNSISPKDFERILRSARRFSRPDSLVVLDEAYYGFKKDYDERAFLSLLHRYDNLVILRSFSKYYALAGLRVGFALWGVRAKEITRFDGLYLGASRLLEELALAAFQSSSYYRSLSRKMIARRTAVISSLNRLEFFKAYASDANFIFIKILLKPSAKNKLQQVEKVLNKLPFVISKFVTPTSLRVSLGLAKGIPEFLAALHKLDRELG